MAFGIDTALVHLDSVNWDAFIAWSKGQLPVFAGRYFIGDSFLYAQAEGTAALSITQGLGDTSNPLGFIAPIQAAHSSRQQLQGHEGYWRGFEDADAMCGKIARAIASGEFSIPDSSFIHVYLAVDSAAPLAVDYWMGWAQTALSIGVSILDKTLGPRTVYPFLPCIYCDFQMSKSENRFYPNPVVVQCLNSVSPLLARCWALWANAPDPANALVMSHSDRFDPGSFNPPFSGPPSSPVPSYSIPVSLWRYAEPAAAIAGGQPLALDVSNDAAVHFMLDVQPSWAIRGQKSNGAFHNATRYGFDVACDVSQQMDCIVGGDLATAAITTWPTAGPWRHDPAQKFGGSKPQFVGRYYKPSVTNPKILGASEVKALGDKSVPVFAIWEDTAWPSPDGFTFDQGVAHALMAFAYAAKIGQPAHTPIYFAIDEYQLAAGGKPAIQRYFRGVQEGYKAYLNNPQDGPYKPRPYEIGVYGPYQVLQWCYEQGVTSYYWQTVGPDDPDSTNNVAWPHLNIWQWVDEVRFCQPMSDNVDLDISWGDEGSWIVLPDPALEP